MQYLALGQRLVTECGVSGTLSTMANQTGEMLRIVNWINAAWNELQTEHDDWGFMRSSNLLGAGASFTTTSGLAYYSLGTGAGTVGVTAANFGKWDRDTFRVYTTSVGTTNETHLDTIPFDAWRDAYMFGAMRGVTTRPVAIAVGPDNSLCLGPPPTASYTVTGDYFIAPTAMSNDTDTPTGLPAQFHLLIVYKAMQYYGAYEAAPEVFNRGDTGYKMLLAQLEALRLPIMSAGSALA